MAVPFPYKVYWLLPVFFLLAGWGGFLFFYGAEAPTAVEEFKVGMSLPDDLFLEGLEGKRQPLAEFAGKALLINFWAGWCGPCLHEMPGLYSLYERYKSKGFVVLGLNMDENPQDGLRVLRQMVGAAPFPLFRGLASLFAERFRIEGLPYTVVVDRKHNIRYARAGEVDWGDPQAQAMIEELL